MATGAVLCGGVKIGVERKSVFGATEARRFASSVYWTRDWKKPSSLRVMVGGSDTVQLSVDASAAGDRSQLRGRSMRNQDLTLSATWKGTAENVTDERGRAVGGVVSDFGAARSTWKVRRTRTFGGKRFSRDADAHVRDCLQRCSVTAILLQSTAEALGRGRRSEVTVSLGRSRLLDWIRILQQTRLYQQMP